MRIIVQIAYSAVLPLVMTFKCGTPAAHLPALAALVMNHITPDPSIEKGVPGRSTGTVCVDSVFCVATEGAKLGTNGTPATNRAMKSVLAAEDAPELGTKLLSTADVPTMAFTGSGPAKVYVRTALVVALPGV